MSRWLLLPPIAFALLLVVIAIIEVAARRLAAQGKESPGKTKAYACGEEAPVNRVRPNYSEFFPVAFFFTVMHVVVLMLATVPQHGLKKLTGMVALYFLAALTGMFILFGDKISRDLKRLLRRSNGL
ncbi:MAG TPA: NADH-quinone oxidoreductase subunit A [Terriglobales bacterium]